MKVLIADDSVIFRTQIRKALEGIDGVQVVAAASNGRIAIRQLEQSHVDLMILDINMPEMDGLETLEAIRAMKHPVKVMIFSSKSPRSAQDTLKALSLGAVDFIVKPEGTTFSVEGALEQIKQQLAPKIRQFLKGAANSPLETPMPAVHQGGGPSLSGSTLGAGIYPKVNVDTFQPGIIVIASSTGGPSALETVFACLKGYKIRVPILIAQHMPETFTRYLAIRLGEIAGIDCHEAVHGESLQSGVVLVAPGNYHLRVALKERGFAAELDQGPRVNSVRPAADLLFSSVAKVYGKRVLGFVLTGMGEDGLVGAKDIKKSGGAIMIQNKESCVVWGMPAAVYESRAYDKIGDLKEIGNLITKVAGQWQA